MRKLFGKIKKDEEGAAAIEFALSFPILLLITAFIFDTGYAMFTLSSLNNAAADAARMGSVGSITLVDVDTGLTSRTLSDARLGEIEAYAAGRAAGLTADTTVVATINTGADGDAIVVDIVYLHRPLMGQLIGFGTITMTANARMLLA